MQIPIRYAWLILLHYKDEVRQRGQEGLYDAVSDSVKASLPVSLVQCLVPHANTKKQSKTYDPGVSCHACCSCLSLGEVSRTGYWSARVLSELKLFITLSAPSRETLSLMDHGGVLSCTCPCHPHTLSTIDPCVTRPCHASLETRGFPVMCEKTLFLSSWSLDQVRSFIFLKFWCWPTTSEKQIFI